MNIFQKIYKYRELLKTNVKKEIRGRYKNSFLGILWSFLNPLLQLAVYSVIFGALLAGGDKTYHIYICVALIPWTYFTAAISIMLSLLWFRPVVSAMSVKITPRA